MRPAASQWHTSFIFRRHPYSSLLCSILPLRGSGYWRLRTAQYARIYIVFLHYQFEMVKDKEILPIFLSHRKRPFVTYSLCGLSATVAELSSNHKRQIGPQHLQYLLSDPLQKKSVTPVLHNPEDSKTLPHCAFFLSASRQCLLFFTRFYHIQVVGGNPRGLWIDFLSFGRKFLS